MTICEMKILVKEARGKNLTDDECEMILCEIEQINFAMILKGRIMDRYGNALADKVSIEIPEEELF